MHPSTQIESTGTFPIYAGLILLGLRSEKYTGKLDWDWIGGRMEENEHSPAITYERELKEECGAIAGKIILDCTRKESFDIHTNDTYTLIPNTITNKYIWLTRCEIQNKEELDSALLLPRPIIPGTSHHVCYRWVTKSEMRDLIEGKQVHGYYARKFMVRIKDYLISHLHL